MADHRSNLPIDPDLDPTDPSQPAVGRRRATRSTERLAPDGLAAIALGGMAGASARFGIGRWVPVEAGTVPWATLGTNLAGSFLIGLVLVVLLDRFPTHRRLRLLLTTGVLGSFTTMATFQVETARLLDDGHVGLATGYALISLALGLPLAVAGMRVAARLPGAPR